MLVSVDEACHTDYDPATLDRNVQAIWRVAKAEDGMTEQQDLESNVRLSESSLWDENRTYYSRRGLDAWAKDGLPYEVTSNPFVAEAFARVLAGWMQGVHSQHQSNLSAGDNDLQTFQLVELGAGTGQLGWSICRALAKYKSLPVWTYTFTDLSTSNVDAMKAHESLRSLRQHMSVDIARFDVEHDEALPVGKGPVAVIATYVFDALRQDAFEIHDSTLFDCRITLRETLGQGDGLDRLSLFSQRQPFVPYPNPSWNAVLREYEAALDEASILFPTAALQFMERVTQARDEVLFLTQTKATTMKTN